MAKRRRRGENRTGMYVGVAVALIAILLGAIVFGLIMLVKLYQGDIGGGEAVDVPDLVGLSEEEARDVLDGAKLLGRRVREDYNDQQDKNRIYDQEPDAGKSIRPGRTIKYYVSLGPANFSVPNLIGVSLDDAPGLLQTAGLRLGNVQKVYTREYPAGRILNQNPKLGSEFTTSVPVDLVVADSGSLPQASMPNLIGLPLAAAEERLTLPENNLHLSLVQYVQDDISPPGMVIEQNVSVGQNVDLGTRIEVKVSIPGLLLAQPQKTIKVRIPIPPGPEKQPVKIKVTDDLGTKVELSEDHAPGDLIERSIDIEAGPGKGRIQIFIGSDKQPWREEVI